MPLTEKTLNAAGYKCRVLLHHVAGAPVMLLHGYSYTIDIWQRIGATELLTEKHVPFLALDMPYGQKSECQPKTHDAQTNVSVAHEAFQSVFGSETPVIVGASLGGNIALHYAAEFPVKGLLLVAPARALEDNLFKEYSRFKFPVRIIWGSEDKIVSGEDMRTLTDKLPCAKMSMYEGAGHSAYVEQAAKFKRELLELYAMAEQT